MDSESGGVAPAKRGDLTKGGVGLMIGKTYLEKGQPVTVLVRWDSKVKGAKRNVLIQREDGSKVVRPFRGLRRATT